MKNIAIIRTIRTMSDAIRLAHPHVTDWEKEHAIAIYVNANRKQIATQIISVGILTTSILHPREIFKPAILLGAAQLILLHNHPSNNVYPSPDDRRIFTKLDKAAALMALPIMDYLIFNRELMYYSFRNKKKYNL